MLAPDRWTVKDILQHLAGSDRNMSYQALMLARKDERVLPGFEESQHVKNAVADNRAIDALVNKIKIARGATAAMFESFEERYFPLIKKNYESIHTT